MVLAGLGKAAAGLAGSWHIKQGGSPNQLLRWIWLGAKRSVIALGLGGMTKDGLGPPHGDWNSHLRLPLHQP
jgi:hypothetical protein